jgi:two-component system phosphate regulon sensor histidine kinase PhoR
MRRQTLLQVWLAIVLAAAAALLFLIPAPDIGPTLLAIAITTAIFALYAWAAWRRLARYLRRLEDYTASLPSKELELPGDLPAEFAMLSSALRRTSQHVGFMIERANLELARRETILAGMAEGVLAVDQKLDVTFCNGAFADAFRTRRPIPEGRPLYEVVREPALREILFQVVSSGAPAKRRVHLPAADGRWFEIHALPLGDNPQTGAIAVLHDITDMHRQEQARKDFVANVSHELRTPLAAIRGYAETLLDGALEDAGVNRKFVEVIQAHAIRLTNIASDLLVLSELDARAPAGAPVEIRVSEVIEAALHTVESAAGMRGVSLRINSPGETYVIGNRLRLEQIIVNLLDNAVKFNRASGTVTVDCSCVDDIVQISVTDTGIGIPSEDLKRIFERFYRVDKARSRQAGGTGLGLSIVRESLERMGGSISVESQLGQGSRFIIRMPSSVTSKKVVPAEDNDHAESVAQPEL